MLLMTCFALAGVARADDVITAEEFVGNVSAMNIGIVNIAQTAIDQDDAGSEIRDFAERLKQDHQTMNSELQTLASSKQLKMADDADARGIANTAKLMVLSGDLFSESFINTQISAHERLIEYIEHAREQLNDDELTQFAKTKLPMLNSHLEMARQLQTMEPTQDQ